jgi:hypothetical protein
MILKNLNLFSKPIQKYAKTSNNISQTLYDYDDHINQNMLSEQLTSTSEKHLKFTSSIIRQHPY